jgi:FolB domain-containing protein
MDKIFVRDLRIRCIIGVNAWEREAPQEIVVNVELFTDTHQAGKTDNLADCIDYDEMAQKIRTLSEKARRFTVEALAEDIACLCLSRSEVRKAAVRVEKPGAVEGAASVGVEIERNRQGQKPRRSKSYRVLRK